MANEGTYCGILYQKNTDNKIVIEDIETGKKDKTSLNFAGTAYQRTTKLMIASGKCREQNKKYHTFLHHDQQTLTVNQELSEAVINTVDNDMRHLKNALLQVITVNSSNNNRTVTTNTFLDSGADSTVTNKEVVTKLGLQGIYCQLNLSSAISATET